MIVWAICSAAICGVAGALIGFSAGTMRYPLGDDALAIEADTQRKRAQSAECKLNEIRKAGGWKL